MTLIFSQGAFTTFHLPCLPTKKVTTLNPNITTHYTRYTPVSPLYFMITHDLQLKLSQDP